jgi:hypothetical protein
MIGGLLAFAFSKPEKVMEMSSSLLGFEKAGPVTGGIQQWMTASTPAEYQAMLSQVRQDVEDWERRRKIKGLET